MMSYQYDTIKVGDITASGDEPFSLAATDDDRLSVGTRKMMRRGGLALLGVLLIAAVAFSSAPGKKAVAENSIPLVGMASSRSCTFDECYEANCNKEVAPFLCVRNNGGPHMGWYVLKLNGNVLLLSFSLTHPPIPV